MPRKASSKKRSSRKVITDGLRSRFERLLAPALIRSLRADKRGTIPLRPAQRKAMREMLEKFMSSERLTKAMADLRELRATRKK